VAGEYIAGMSPTVHVPAMLGYSVGSQYVPKQITVIGVDEATYATVSDFGQFLQHPENRKQLDFQLKHGGYDTIDHQANDPSKALPRVEMQGAGWRHRQSKARFAPVVTVPKDSVTANPFTIPPGEVASATGDTTDYADQGTAFDPAKDQHTGAVLGIGLCAYRTLDGADGFLAVPGDDVEISYPTASRPPKVLTSKFTIVDFYESKMSEYDSSFVFIPIRKLQEIRGMVDPDTGVAFCNAIQIRLKNGVELNTVRDRLRENFDPRMYKISTWKDKEGALLAAVQMETAVLNVLLFLIIAVAGFGILAIFCMIVFEKTRDIGIMKSLGATGWGILGIFLSYGFLLGIVGAGVGLGLGLLFVRYINEIADLLGRATGRPVFDPSIYYFQKIPAIVEVWTVSWIVVGALAIAVVASILPSLRAALLHPVQALRYE
jgi:lipoprotein-releasing system permease protein